MYVLKWFIYIKKEEEKKKMTAKEEKLNFLLTERKIDCLSNSMIRNTSALNSVVEILWYHYLVVCRPFICHFPLFYFYQQYMKLYISGKL